MLMQKDMKKWQTRKDELGASHAKVHIADAPTPLLIIIMLLSIKFTCYVMVTNADCRSESPRNLLGGPCGSGRDAGRRMTRQARSWGYPRGLFLVALCFSRVLNFLHLPQTEFLYQRPPRH